MEPPVRRVLAVGAGGLERECRDAGLEVVTGRTPRRGWPRRASTAGRRPDSRTPWSSARPQFTYQKLAVAVMRASRRTVRGTNRDPVFPNGAGHATGAGAIVAAVEAGAG